MLNVIQGIEDWERFVEKLDIAKIKELDRASHCGNPAHNEETEDLLLYPPKVIESFVRFQGVQEDNKDEGLTEKLVGGLIKGIVCGKDMVDRQ